MSAPRPDVEEPARARVINATVEDHPLLEPLQLNESYSLAFWVDLEPRPGAVSAPFADDRAFEPGEDWIDLEVYLSSNDVEVLTDQGQRLSVGRTGRSRNKARFDIAPLRLGRCAVTALFYKRGNFVQGMALSLGVGGGTQAAIVTLETLGRPPEGAFALQPRDLSLFIKPTVAGYELTMVGAVAAQATLRLSPHQLQEMVDTVRTELRKIVYLGIDGVGGVGVYTELPPPPGVNLVYQSGLDIPPAADKEAMKRLASVGQRLYQQIFYDSGDAQAALLGDRLRAAGRAATLTIQIVSQDFVLPWGVLYLADDAEFDPDNVNPALFLGFAHIVEQLPLQQQMAVLDSDIPSDQPRLAVSVNIDADIDSRTGVALVGPQLAYWDRVRDSGRVSLTLRRSDEEFRQALASPAAPDQILYFYGHAHSPVGSPASSSLTFTGGRQVTLPDLRLRAGVKQTLPGAPLVFINACDSAQLSPLFYDGFVQYFTAKGARGMIGSECEVPAIFAAAWAQRFFEDFLAGRRSLGAVFLMLRRDFRVRHRNVLGLVYAMYCDGDTRVTPGLLLR